MPACKALRPMGIAPIILIEEASEVLRLAIEAGKRFSAERWLEGWMPDQARRAVVLARLYRLGLPRGS